MQKERSLNLFLAYVLFALMFCCLYPIYFSYGEITVRTVSLDERMLSLLFVLSWLLLSAYIAWKKRVWLLLGAGFYGLLSYLPDAIMPLVSGTNAGAVKLGFRYFAERIYELTGAPMAGISLLFSDKASVSLSKWLLPILLLTYAGVQLFRFYRNAFLAEQLHLEDNAYYPNPTLARELAASPNIPIARPEAGRATPGSRPESQSLEEDTRARQTISGDTTRIVARPPQYGSASPADPTREETRRVAPARESRPTEPDSVIRLGGPTADPSQFSGENQSDDLRR